MASDGAGVLEASLACRFSPNARKKGYSYCFDYDCVKDLSIEPNRIKGYVKGGQDYEVELYYTRLNGAVEVTDFYCECAHFEEGFNCKHIWAAILECDYLATDDSRWKQFLSLAASDEDRLDELLARVGRQASATADSFVPVHRDFLFGEARKQQIRLSYVFEVLSGRLKLFIFKQKQKVNGEWGVASRYKFTKRGIESAPTESQHLLRLLTGYESPESADSSYSYNFSIQDQYDSFEVTSEWSDDVWKPLAESERVFWSLDSEAGESQWRKLAIDVNRPYSLNFEIRREAEDKNKSVDRGRQWRFGHCQRSNSSN